MDENIHNIVILPGAEQESRKFANAYDLGRGFAKLFPGQDAEDFVYCCDGPAGWGPLAGKDLGSITELKMVQEGQNDGDDWIWEVTIDGVTHTCTGGCDYTGWGCQDWGEWKINGPAPVSDEIKSLRIPE